MSLNRKPYHSPIAIEMMKIAKEKGLIEEPKQQEDIVGKLHKAVAAIDKEVGIEKKAEKRSFASNVIDLCNQLRSTGFGSYAQEIESKFLTFKQAETHLYNVNGETGEDVLNMAHPDGSNDLGLGHEAEVETLLDKQKKILDVIRKQPKGKLAAKTAINAVKLLLAQQAPEQITLEKKYNNDALANLKQALQYYKLIENTVFEKGKLYLRKSTFVQLSETIKEKLNSYNPTIDDINDIEKYIKAVRGLIRPGATGGVSSEAWSLLENHFMSLISPTGPLEKARSNIEKRNRIISNQQSKELNKENTTITPTQAPKLNQDSGSADEVITDDIGSKIDYQIKRLDGFAARLELDTKKYDQEEIDQANKFIKDQKNDFSKVKSIWERLPDDQKSAVTKKYNELVKENDQFYVDWIQ